MPLASAAAMTAALVAAAMGVHQRRTWHRERMADATTPRLPALLGALARLPSPRVLRNASARPDPGPALVAAGIPRGEGTAVMVRARAGGMLVGVVAGVAVGVVATPLVAAAPLLVVGLRLLPDRLLGRRAVGRRRAIVDALPDLLDLMVICVESGMALDPALRMASTRLGGPLGDEVAVMLDAQALGTPRRAAYRALANRVGSDDVGRLVAALLQAEELGTPLAHALAGQAEALRAVRRQVIRDRAARAAPRIQLVVALVMVPGALLLVLGVMLVELAAQIAGVTG